VSTDEWIGTTLAGYRIETVIGRGGMGVVYRADHLSLGRKIALKVLAPALAANDSFRRRFVHESRMAASIEHPNIIPIYEAGEAEGLLFLAMRYVEGPDLGKLLIDGPLAPRRTVNLLGQAAAGLDAAHARGLVHRDVKPGNILVAAGLTPGSGEHAYLCDFGLIKPFDTPSDLTFSGQFFGTVPYMPPEQIQGDPLDGRSDVYALGCVAYRCLTGSLPFRRDSDMATVEAHLHEPPPRVTDLRPDLPPALDPVVARAMAKSKHDRYGTCAELVGALRDALAGAPSGGRATRQLTAPLAPAVPPVVPPRAPEPETLAEPTVASAPGGAPMYGPEPAHQAPAGPPVPLPPPVPPAGPPGGYAPAYADPAAPRWETAPPRRQWHRSPAVLLVAVFTAVSLVTWLAVSQLRGGGGGDPPATTVVAAGVDTAKPGSADGKPGATCVNGWTLPRVGSDTRTRPLDALRDHLGVRGLFTLIEMRTFTGSNGARTWYVKTAKLAGRPFEGRFLVRAPANGAAEVVAVAPSSTKGLASPDWRSFTGGGKAVEYPDLPGSWSGTPGDFVARGGLPADVRGCLGGS
jgi:hypothetical protein